MKARSPRPRPVKVTLSCGCGITLCNPPIYPRHSFPCPSNLGHGYNLRWASYTDFSTGRSSMNPSVPQESTV